MTAFALDLNHDGIRLLRRDGQDWDVLGVVALDDPQLPARMHALRETAEQLADGALETELIIPQSEILYALLPFPPGGGAPTDDWIRAGLAGKTTCPLDELVLDWRMVEEGIAVAALDVNTLDEAESFAVPYGFNPSRFAARPEPDQFPDIPDFGPTQFMREQDTPEAAVFHSLRAEDEEDERQGVSNLFSEEPETGAEAEGQAPEPEEEIVAFRSMRDADGTGLDGEAEKPPADEPAVFESRRSLDEAEPDAGAMADETPPPAALPAAASAEDEEASDEALTDDFTLSFSRDVTEPGGAPETDDLTTTGDGPEDEAGPAPASEPEVFAEPGAEDIPEETADDDTISAGRVPEADELPPADILADDPEGTGTPDGIPQESPDAADTASSIDIPADDGPTEPDEFPDAPETTEPVETPEPLLPADEEPEPVHAADEDPVAAAETPSLEEEFAALGAVESGEAEPAVFESAEPAHWPEAPAPEPGPGSVPKAPPLAAPPRPRRSAPAPGPRTPADWRKTALTISVWAAIGVGLVATALYLVRPEELPEPEPVTESDQGSRLEQAATPEVAETEGVAPAEVSPAPVPDPTPRFAGDPAGSLAEPPIGALPEPDRLTPVVMLARLDIDPARMAARGEMAQALPGALSEDRVVIQLDRLYARDMWHTPPPPPPELEGGHLENLYVASIDPAIRHEDALQLNQTEPDTPSDQTSVRPPEPNPAFDLDADGLVVATPEGVETPDGVMVYLGTPPVVPVPRPTDVIVAVGPDTAALADKRPALRPDDLVERVERRQFGGRSRAELALLKPHTRPPSPQELAVRNASLVPSELAVARSRLPQGRPENFAAVVAAAAAAKATEAAAGTQPQTTPTDPAQPPADPQVAAAPDIPTSASVARQATIKNAIKLRRVNLIGVYGSESDRRALVRLPSGRYKKVQVGDRIDGGRVAVIGDNRIVYVKHGRNVTLEVPSG